jgi:hypothetical protein
MQRFISHLTLLTLGTAMLQAQQVEELVVAKAVVTSVTDDGSPVKIPNLDYYERLWTESLITTRALPPPEAPAGPKFTDNLTLTGSYEMNGKVVAVLIDKTTSGIIEAYIGEENADGMKIVKVDGNSASDIKRVQLQKGTELGWVTLPDPNTVESTPAQAPGGLMPNPNVIAQQPAQPQLQSNVPNIPQPPAVPAPNATPAIPSAPAMQDDIPLPPP